MKTHYAYFGGGCFWCTEATFQNLRGVIEAVPGYAGGKVENPGYQQVTTGTTGHAEVVRVAYDPEVISYKDLLKVFFAIHDPTTLNRQGNDSGPQYRSIILFVDDEQRQEVENYIAEISPDFDNRIVTELKPLTAFYEAEDYHHDYFKKNPNAGYCQVIISPKVAKMRKEFAEMLKE